MYTSTFALKKSVFGMVNEQNMKNVGIFCVSFLKFIKKEFSILQHSLPQGIFVKAFENRSDLFSAMIEGPENTPYEGGLFFFEIQLPSDYPHSPPKFHHRSYNEPSENCRIKKYRKHFLYFLFMFFISLLYILHF